MKKKGVFILLNKSKKAIVIYSVVLALVLTGLATGVVIYLKNLDDDISQMIDESNSEFEDFTLESREDLDILEEVPEKELPVYEEEFEEQEQTVETTEEEFDLDIIDWSEERKQDKQDMTEEEQSQKEQDFEEYVKNNSNETVSEPNSHTLSRLREDNPNWDLIYLTKGNFIWWLQNDFLNSSDYILNVQMINNSIVIGTNEEQQAKYQEERLMKVIEHSGYAFDDLTIVYEKSETTDLEN